MTARGNRGNYGELFEEKTCEGCMVHSGFSTI